LCRPNPQALKATPPGKTPPIDNLVILAIFPSMTTSVYELKANLSRFLEAVESGKEVIVSRHKRPVARIVPIAPLKTRRIGTLDAKGYKMGPGFDRPALSDLLADDFGIPRP
jgi:prevent-host-death family protein